MTNPRVVHFRADLSAPNTPGVAICGTVDVWHNWTPFAKCATCKKCRAIIFGKDTQKRGI